MTALRAAAVLVLAFTTGCAGGTGSSTTGPSSTSSSIAGKWIGNAPDGLIVDVINGNCPRAFDVEFNFNSNTSGTIGTATTRLRETPCLDVLNGVHTYDLNKGTVSGAAVTFDFGGGSYHFSGTVAGSKLTGSFSIIEFPQSGHFVATRQ